MLPSNKAQQNRIASSILSNLLLDKDISEYEVSFLDAVIRKEIKKWVGLKTYWNIRAMHLIEYFKNHYLLMGVHLKLELINCFSDMDKDPHQWRFLKPFLQDKYEKIMTEGLATTDIETTSPEGHRIVLEVKDKTLILYIPDKKDPKTLHEYFLEFTFDDLYGASL